MAYYIRIRKLDPVTSTVVQQVGNITINGCQAGTVLGVPGTGLYSYALEIAADPGEVVTCAGTSLVAFSTRL